MPFISFEGIDGSGKSSLLENFKIHLKGLGLPVETTKEPGGTQLGKDLRNILLRTNGEAPCPRAELLIYEADRAQHVEVIIKPLLQKGFWILSDRYADSSLAFQGAGRKLDKEKVVWLNSFATSGLVPDLTVLLDCTVEVAETRRASREDDRMESEKLEFHQMVRDEYLTLAKHEPKRFLVLDAMKTPKQLFEELLQEVKNRKIL